MTRVDIVNFEREVAAIRDDLEAAIGDVLDSGWFVLGEQVARFEERFASVAGVDHAVGLNSGTDALELGLRALDVGTGDEVVTVSHTATATAAAIRTVGAEPVYVDVDPGTMVMDVDRVADAITDRTAAIIPVHLYGHPVDMEPLLDAAATHDVSVIEDCSQAHGAQYRGSPVGSFGDVAAFSLYPTKNLGAYGDGGVAVTDDPAIADRIERLREYGWEERYRPTEWGRNSRLDEIQAAILNVKVEHLPDWNRARRETADTYDRLLADAAVQTPVRPAHGTHVFHQYVVRTDRRTDLRRTLEDEGISTLVHYPVPVHRQQGYESNVSLPTTETVAERVVSLPVHPFLTDEQRHHVAATVSALLD